MSVQAAKIRKSETNIESVYFLDFLHVQLLLIIYLHVAFLYRMVQSFLAPFQPGFGWSTRPVCRKILSIKNAKVSEVEMWLALAKLSAYKEPLLFGSGDLQKFGEQEISHKKTSIWVGEQLERPIILWACSRSSPMAMSMAVVFPGEVLILKKISWPVRSLASHRIPRLLLEFGWSMV